MRTAVNTNYKMLMSGEDMAHDLEAGGVVNEEAARTDIEGNAF